jgi:ATPase subunit of ABC transporter with duplicated ATPase domains
VSVFNGGYTSYEGQVDVERAHQAQQYEKEQKEKYKLKRLLVKAQSSASSASHAKNRDNDKMLRNFKNEGKQAKSGQEVQRMKTKLESVEQTQKIVDPKIYKTALVASDRRSGLILNVDALSKEAFTLSPQSFTLQRGQRLYVAGKNGSGKSTLLNILTGRDSQYEGMFKWSASARVGYFSQDVYGLDTSLSVLEVLSTYYDDVQDLYKQCRTLGFTPVDMQRKVRTLSRGQQAKVGFVSLLLQSYNVLVLDEPTNHLDITSRAIIEDALVRYEGAIIFTSHDRYFVEQVGFEVMLLL